MAGSDIHEFLIRWHEAASTTLGLFWMALWAFGLGYLVSGMIQVFVTRQRMRRSMGASGPRSVALATFFGFLSSSCSFAALATTRSLFAKGAGLVPSLAFLLASSNLVIELGIVIAVFLGWQFVVGEYVGGLLLIALTWLVVHFTRPRRLIDAARAQARTAEGDDEELGSPDWKALMTSRAGWAKVAQRYVMEWHMVWKDVTIGFSVAGIIAAFVPRSFFQTLFVGSGQTDPSLLELTMQALVGPLAAFFTFIGSMGNIPLAAVLYDNGVSFAGIMAFVFSDLVVLPVLRIQARYYGWRIALYILGVFLVVLVASALLLHYGFAAFAALPEAAAGQRVVEREFFAVDYTAILNVMFLLLSLVFVLWSRREHGLPRGGGGTGERVLTLVAGVAALWLAAGLALPWVGLAAV